MKCSCSKVFIETLTFFRLKEEFGRQDDDDEDVHALDAGDAWRGRGEEGGDGGVKGGGQGAGGPVVGVANY